MYKTYHIVKFFNDYVKNDYIGNFFEGFYQDYVSFFLILALILTLIGIALILALFIYKKKPLKVYISSMIFYIMLLIVFIFVKKTMINMETNVITVEYSRIIRDITIISLIPQIFMVIAFLIRGLGFNIHKFDFEKDLKDLKISNEDNEEVEITIKNDGTKVKRVIRRFFREFGYYIKENKIMFILIIVFLIMLIGILIYKNLPKNYDFNYKEGDTFNSLGLTYNFEDSILTNIDYRGNLLSKDSYYLVVKLKITNNTNNNYKLDYKQFKLENGNNDIFPIRDLGINFIDFAPNFQGNNITKSESNTFSLIFKINADEIKNKYKIKIDNGYVNNNKDAKSKYIYVTIKPEIIDNIETVKKANINEEIDFSHSNLGNTTLKITDLLTTKKYLYTYEFCLYGKCQNYNDQVVVKTDKTSMLFVIGYEYLLDNNVPFYKTSKTLSGLISNFGRLYYLNDNEMLYSSINNFTPDNLKDKIVLEVSESIATSNEVYLSLLIRNKEYLIRIK